MRMEAKLNLRQLTLTCDDAEPWEVVVWMIKLPTKSLLETARVNIGTVTGDELI